MLGIWVCLGAFGQRFGPNPVAKNGALKLRTCSLMYGHCTFLSSNSFVENNPL